MGNGYDAIGEGTAYIFVAVEDVNFAAPETSMGHRASVPILENIGHTSSCVVNLGNFRAVSGGTSRRGSGDVTVWAVPDAAEDRIESRKNVNQYQMSRIGTPMS